MDKLKQWIPAMLVLAAIIGIGSYAPQWVTNVTMIIGLLVVIAILGSRIDQTKDDDGGNLNEE